MHKKERPVFWVLQRKTLLEIYYIIFFFIYYQFVMDIIAFESVIGFAAVSPLNTGAAAKTTIWALNHPANASLRYAASRYSRWQNGRGAKPWYLRLMIDPGM